ncbi:hypothetical protein JZ751_015788 [Albula glossodonta]|uniref:Uncharacterized protein n=1 Tax=Albula glossodonta TaxID=121402 RepID=A0A8T2MR89_9TELE|nr:hypothetical protein JZ751_015788 [Albula glossodonta]
MYYLTGSDSMTLFAIYSDQWEEDSGSGVPAEVSVLLFVEFQNADVIEGLDSRGSTCPPPPPHAMTGYNPGVPECDQKEQVSGNEDRRCGCVLDTAGAAVSPPSLWSAGLKPHGNRSRVVRLAANQTPPAHVALVLRVLLLCCLGSLLLPSIPK